MSPITAAEMKEAEKKVEALVKELGLDRAAVIITGLKGDDGFAFGRQYNMEVSTYLVDLYPNLQAILRDQYENAINLGLAKIKAMEEQPVLKEGETHGTP